MITLVVLRIYLHDPAPKKLRTEAVPDKLALKDKELSLEDHWADLGLQVQTALKMSGISPNLKRDTKAFESRYLSSKQNDFMR